LIGEKKKLSRKCKELENELEDIQRSKQGADAKHRSSSGRLEDAMKKIKDLEESLDEQEKVMIRRHNEINGLLKDNRIMKEDLEFIRLKYGSVAQIK